MSEPEKSEAREALRPEGRPEEERFPTREGFLPDGRRPWLIIMLKVERLMAL